MAPITPPKVTSKKPIKKITGGTRSAPADAVQPLTPDILQSLISQYSPEATTMGNSRRDDILYAAGEGSGLTQGNLNPIPLSGPLGPPDAGTVPVDESGSPVPIGTRSFTDGEGATNQASTPFDPHNQVYEPSFLPPIGDQSSFPVRGQVTAQMPQYGFGQGSEQDKKNFLLGLSLLPLLGGNISASLPAYTQEGLQSLDKNFDRQYGEGLQAYKMQQDRVNQEFADSAARVKFNQVTTKNQNDANNNFNTLGQKEFGIKSTAHTAEEALRERRRTARVNAIMEQAKPWLEIIKNQGPLGFKPAEVAKAQANLKAANDILESWQEPTIPNPDVPTADSTKFEQQKNAQEAHTSDVHYEQTHSDARTSALVGNAQFLKKMGIDAAAAEQASKQDFQGQQNERNRINARWLAQSRESAAMTLAKWKTEHPGSEMSPRTMGMNKLNSNLLDAGNKLDKYTNEILNFGASAGKGYFPDANGSYAHVDNASVKQAWRDLIKTRDQYKAQVGFFSQQMQNIQEGKPFSLVAPPFQGTPNAPYTPSSYAPSKGASKPVPQVTGGSVSTGRSAPASKAISSGVHTPGNGSSLRARTSKSVPTGTIKSVVKTGVSAPPKAGPKKELYPGQNLKPNQYIDRHGKVQTLTSTLNP